MRTTLRLIVALVVLSLPTPAFAQAPRVVVETFRGPRASSLRQGLVQSLERGGVTVVSHAEVDMTRARLGIPRTMSPEQRSQLTQELNVSVFIEGRVRRRRRRWTGTVRVLNAVDGNVLGSASWGGRTAASLNGIRRNGYARLSDFIGSATAASLPPPPPPVVVPQPRLPEHEDPDEEPLPVPPSDERWDTLRFGVIGGSLFRQMETTVQIYETQRGNTPADPARALQDEMRRYTSGGIGHFELGISVEFYPGALADDQRFPYIGLLASFAHSLGVQSNATNRTDGTTVAVPTNQFEVFAGLRGRYRFGSTRPEPEIHLDIGWGMFQFGLGGDALELIRFDTIIPPMQHGYVHIGAGIAYGVVPTYLTIGFDIGGRIGTSTGGDTRNLWGINTGPSNGFQIGANARFEYPDGPHRFFATLTLQYFQMITDFNGQVGCVREGECSDYIDPWDDRRLWEVWPVTAPAAGAVADVNDVVGGPRDAVTDHYVRLQLAVGYAFY